MSNPARPGEREKPACSKAGDWSLPLMAVPVAASETGTGTGTHAVAVLSMPAFWSAFGDSTPPISRVRP